VLGLGRDGQGGVCALVLWKPHVILATVFTATRPILTALFAAEAAPCSCTALSQRKRTGVPLCLPCALPCAVFDLHVRRSRSKSLSSLASLGVGAAKNGEMDLGSFLDLVLALDNKHTPEGLAYIFKCLDLNERGYLTTADVYTLFRYAPFLCGNAYAPRAFKCSRHGKKGSLLIESAGSASDCTLDLSSPSLPCALWFCLQTLTLRST